MENSRKQFLSPFHSRASILIISIWVLVLFSILSLALYKIISPQLKLVRAQEEATICPYLAKAAYTYAALEKKKDKTTYDSLGELRRERKKDLGRGSFVYTIVDEESKININTASTEVILRLPGLDDTELVQNIIQSELRPFHYKEEILLVKEMTQETYDKFKDFITVYSSGKVNINSAPVEVLQALGMSAALIKAINTFRFFSDTGGIIDGLREVEMLYEADQAMLLQLITQGLITVSSASLCLQVETAIVSKPARKYNIVMDKEKIKQWQEY
jgi:DNA uptake protein ComE-like DNA-binding protein